MHPSDSNAPAPEGRHENPSQVAPSAAVLCQLVGADDRVDRVHLGICPANLLGDRLLQPAELPAGLFVAKAVALGALMHPTKTNPRPGWVRGEQAMTPATRAEVAELKAMIAQLEAQEARITAATTAQIGNAPPTAKRRSTSR